MSTDAHGNRRPLLLAVALVLVAGAALATLLDRHLSGGEASTDTGPRPAAAALAPVAFDAADDTLVMLDGAQTWTWDGSRWQRAATTTEPITGGAGVRVTAKMAYDPRSHRVLLYVPGFQPGCIPPGSDMGVPCGPYHPPATWSWDGMRWRSLAAATPDHALAMVLDQASGRILLLGAATDRCGATSTWLWSGSGWSESSTPGPMIASEIAIVGATTDPRTGDALLVDQENPGFASKLPGCPLESGIWRWNGTSWLQISASLPWGISGEAFSVGADPATAQVIAVEGSAHTWVWNGSTWKELHPARSPVERIGPTLVEDPAHHQMLLVGGLGGVSGCSTVADTWSWDGAGWTPLAPVNQACVLSGDSAH